jgi:hypothetical protein
MHINLIKQIKYHCSENYINNNGDDIVIINNEEYIIPIIPHQFTSTQHNELFIKGIFKSKFFIN